MNAPIDALHVALDGIRAVEASAGTGKTFTIATLYLRLILERGLKVDGVVVATFTRAAAAELSSRLRERLCCAERVLDDDDADTPRADDDGDTSETRKVIGQALRNGVPLDELRQRAREARLAIDTACIGTLHGFCHRVLAEFGFDTGQALRQPDLIEDIRELEAEIVRDFWRRGSADATVARQLADTWDSPEALARQVCDSRWRGRVVDVPEPDFQRMQVICDAARARIAAWDAAALQAATAGLRNCVSHPPTLKQRTAALQGLHAWAGSSQHDEASSNAAIELAQSLCAKALDTVNPKGEHAHGPAFDDVETFCIAHAQLAQAHAATQKLPAAHLLHEAREYLEAERPRRLAERNLMGHDEAVDLLDSVLADPARGATIAARIRSRWQAALIDEFQDTDAAQWRVARALFGATSLVLVGDPKQAIYGFRGGDVYAWLQAVAQADGEPLRLLESQRTGTGLCHAINALFSPPRAFIEAGIEHPDVRAASRVATRALWRNGKPEAALQVWQLDEYTSKPAARADIERACVGWIATLLDDEQAQLHGVDGGPRRPCARDIAVLVNSNSEAQSMQAALGRAGVPAASNLRASVYASDEAADLALLVDALAAPDDARRARAARASLLVGDDAATIADAIDAAQATLLETIAGWAANVQRRGPLPWLHALIALAAPRLLALADGERRVANYLQLAELLQELHARSFGLQDLAVRFARARVEATDDADAARLRLDTDANAVTVSTVHAAKGLEYSIVLVPYAVLGKNPTSSRDPVPLRWYHEGGVARVTIGAGTDGATVERAIEEVRAEDVRKLYVAVTRAKALCVLPFGLTSGTEFSAVGHLLHAASRDPTDSLAFDAAGCARAITDLCARAPDAVAVRELPSAHARRAPTDTPPVLAARSFSRVTLERDWQTWSFSRLIRGSTPHVAPDPLPGAGDISPASVSDGLAGARFGTAVHAVFERTGFAAWRDANGVPASERPLIERALREQGLAERSRASLDRAITLVGNCIRATLNATLPCGVRLCEVAPAQHRAEIEFHLTLAPAQTLQLFKLLHAHGYQHERSGVAPSTLHGLLTGKIDLVFAHAGQFHIIDWKTNRCAPYDAAAMRAEIATHDYDLQWLIYTLALHRWLRQQLADYDYTRHVGEVYYLFVRGMVEGGGVHVDRPPRELIEALDALFGAGAAAAA